jgi:hypothetical protein
MRTGIHGGGRDVALKGGRIGLAVTTIIFFTGLEG